MQIDPENFKFIFSLIENHHVFSNQFTFPQVLLKSELKVTFYKLANDGSASGFVLSNVQWKVFEGHINNYI